MTAFCHKCSSAHWICPIWIEKRDSSIYAYSIQTCISIYICVSTCEHMYVNICETIHIYINVFCLHIYIYMIQIEYIHKSLQNVNNEKYLHDTTGYTLATWSEELTHWKRPWCWEGLKAGGEGDDRSWVGWMASLTWWTWVWASSGSWRCTGKPGVLQSMGSQKVGYDCTTELNTLIYQFF